MIETVLAHTVGDATARAYRRTDLFDKRRELMALWASYCANPEFDKTNVSICRSTERRAPYDLREEFSLSTTKQREKRDDAEPRTRHRPYHNET